MPNEILTIKQFKQELADMEKQALDDVFRRVDGLALPDAKILRSHAESIGMKDGDTVSMGDDPGIFRVVLVDSID